MKIITLTTDFGLKDFSVSSIKGTIYSLLPDCRVIDISHDIPPFDLLETAYILGGAYSSFPEGSVHIIGVDALFYPTVKSIIAKINNHYFICNDNGILSLIDNYYPEEIIEIKREIYKNNNFLVKDVFAPVACQLLQNISLNKIGKKIKTIKHLTAIKPIEKENSLLGVIIYNDNHGNSVTNIHKDLFEKFGKGRSFIMYVRNYQFTKILNNYTDIIKDPKNESKYHGEDILIFNYLGYLQICIYKSNSKTVGGANTLMGLEKGTTIQIIFN